MAGDWAADDLAGVLAAFAAGARPAAPAPLQPVGAAARAAACPRTSANTLDRRRAQHLAPLRPVERALRALPRRDDDLLVSPCSSRATRSRRPSGASTRRCAELADVGPSHHVLEIGTGWGGMAMHAAATRGCRVTSATISRAQAELARERIAAAGLADLIDVVLCDYREVEGSFDRIVSVEMFEAVGERYWPHVLRVCDRLAAAGRRGRACRRSRCPTAATGRRGARTAGCTSTSSRAA